MGGFFSIDGKVFSFMSRVFDILFMNIVFVIMCIPIVTIGANITAAYYVAMKMVRKEDGYLLRNYWESFKLNFKQATSIWLIIVFVGVILGIDIVFFYRQGPGIWYIGFYVSLIFLFLYVMCTIYVFPILSRFENTVKVTIINTFKMMLIHLKWTLLLVIIIGLPAVACLLVKPQFGVLYFLIMLVCGSFLTIYLSAMIFNHIFSKYMVEEKETDINI